MLGFIERITVAEIQTTDGRLTTLTVIERMTTSRTYDPYNGIIMPAEEVLLLPLATRMSVMAE
jgi:hypothetical protein